jgi:hypothetical protein
MTFPEQEPHLSYLADLPDMRETYMRDPILAVRAAANLLRRTNEVVGTHLGDEPEVQASRRRLVIDLLPAVAPHDETLADQLFMDCFCAESATSTDPEVYDHFTALCVDPATPPVYRQRAVAQLIVDAENEITAEQDTPQRALSGVSHTLCMAALTSTPDTYVVTHLVEFAEKHWAPGDPYVHGSIVRPLAGAIADDYLRLAFAGRHLAIEPQEDFAAFTLDHPDDLQFFREFYGMIQDHDLLEGAPPRITELAAQT